MKTAVTITLVIAGSLLIAVPLLADHLERAQVAEVLVKRDAASISLSPTLSNTYRLGCWLTGTAMVAMAIVSSRRSSANGDLKAAN